MRQVMPPGRVIYIPSPGPEPEPAPEGTFGPPTIEDYTFTISQVLNQDLEVRDLTIPSNVTVTIGTTPEGGIPKIRVGRNFNWAGKIVANGNPGKPGWESRPLPPSGGGYGGLPANRSLEIPGTDGEVVNLYSLGGSGTDCPPPVTFPPAGQYIIPLAKGGKAYTGNFPSVTDFLATSISGIPICGGGGGAGSTTWRPGFGDSDRGCYGATGGGVVDIHARNILLTVGASVSARGGDEYNMGNTSFETGPAGGGGFVKIVSETPLPPGLGIDARGGTGQRAQSGGMGRIYIGSPDPTINGDFLGVFYPVFLSFD